MSGEMRVTIVATGLGHAGSVNAEVARVKLVRTVGGDVDYRELDKPAIIRRSAVQASPPATREPAPDDQDYLDIPAFLRRQAD
jgi:cell division protein FtsZ